LVERYGIAWHEKTLGQLFCDGSARAIVEMLLAECERGGVEIVLNARGIAVEGGGRVSRASSQGEFGRRRWWWRRGIVDSEAGGDGAGV
jgi:predicted flavoprotein YhiN